MNLIINFKIGKFKKDWSDATSVTATTYISLGTCRPFSNVEYAKIEEAARDRNKKKSNDLQFSHWPQECKTFAALQRPLVAPMHKHVHMSIRSDPHCAEYPSDPN